MLGRGRTHHHLTKQKSEDQSRRPTVAMDCYCMKMKSVVNAQTMSEESVTCLAVKEDIHQNIMNSVALKKGVEEPLTIERVVNFIDLHGYHEIALKSDTEPAIIAFRNGVAEMWKSRSHHRGRSEKRQRIERAHRERSDARSWNHLRHITCHVERSTQETLSDESPTLPWLVQDAGCILSRCPKGRDGKTPSARLHGKKPSHSFVPVGEKVLAQKISTDPLSRVKPRYKFGSWLGMRNNIAYCFIGNADGACRAREIRR